MTVQADLLTPVDISAPRGAVRRLVDVWRFRSLLGNLTRRELRVKYKGSALGFLWSLLNPAMYLVVFSLVFTELLRTEVPKFGLFLLSGLVVWNFFSGALLTGSTAIVANRSLVQKVWFPREVLPLSVVGASLVNMFLQSLVLVAGLVIFQRTPDVVLLPLLLLALLVAIVFTTGLVLASSALNVGYRDTQHLLDVGLTAWFWLSAVVYPFATIADRLGDWEPISVLNPILPVVVTFQRVLYNPDAPAAGEEAIHPDLAASWYLARLGAALAISLVVLLVGLWVFRKAEDDFGDRL